MFSCPMLRRVFALLACGFASSAFALEPAPPRPGDGARTIYAIMIGEGSYPHFAWRDARDMFLFLRDVRGANPANLFVLLTSDVVPPDQPAIVDGLATRANIEAALAHCVANMDADDLFFWQVETHGNGYMGRVPGDPANAAYHGYFGVQPRIASGPEDERDFLEQDLELSILCGSGLKDGRDYHYGLNQWGVRWYPGVGGNMLRMKVVSHFTDVAVEGRGLLADSDVLLERFTDYALGDLNRNGIVDAGENMDTDGDGLPAYDGYTRAFDEDEWGAIDGFEDDVYYGWHSSLVGIPFQVFDANLDGHLDVDIHPTGGLQVDGTDFDNDGTIDGFDLDGDGLQTSWVAMDETMGIYWDALDDDELRSYLAAFTNGIKVVVTSTCMGGGFINDLSAPNTIIIAGSREMSEAPQGLVHDSFRTAFTLYGAQADTDGNGYVSFAEAFNMARIHPHFSCDPYMDRYQYDDNGDRVPHEGPLTSTSADGAFGATVYWEGNLPRILSSAVTPPALSPNNDGIHETAGISAQADVVVMWTTTIRDQAGQVVRTLVAGPSTTLSAAWNGRNTAGAVVPDGNYLVEVAAAAANGLAVRRPAVSVRVDNTKPVVTNLRDTPDPFRPTRGESSLITFTMSEGGSLDVGIYNSSQVRIRTVYLGQTAALSQSLSWDGRNEAGAGVPNGTYTYKIKVTDAAGNASLVYQGTSQKR
jgi:flagellar hook assembly protein FlgD